MSCHTQSQSAADCLCPKGLDSFPTLRLQTARSARLRCHRKIHVTCAFLTSQLISDTSQIQGDIRAGQAELNVDFGPTAQKDPGHRLVNPDLAGGALLDLGPYPWTTLYLALMPLSSASTEPHQPLKIASGMTKTRSGVDASTIAVIEYPSHRRDNNDEGNSGEGGVVIHGTLTTAQDRQTPYLRSALITGSKGYVEVSGPLYRPEKLRVLGWDSEQALGDEPERPKRDETFEFTNRPGGIWGFAWEADEVAQCLNAGKKESERMPLRDTLLMMQSFDEMRKQGQLVYPEAVETTEL